MDKTVVGCGYYMPAGERADYVQRVRTVFADVLPEENVQCEGQILLGTPMGDDKTTRSSESFSGSAPVYIGPNDATDSVAAPVPVPQVCPVASHITVVYSVSTCT